MIKLSPSILAADFANLRTECARAVEGGADLIHVDIMDGHFVPNLTIGPTVVASLAPQVSVPLDVHLMVDAPWKYIPQLCKAGVGYITVHVESFDSTAELQKTLAAIREGGAHPGVTLRPGTDESLLLPVLDQVDLVLVMSVEPGFGGQKLMPAMLDRLRRLGARLAEVNPHCLLEVDGGVHLGTAADVAQAGATVIVAGSAVFAGEETAARAAALKRKLNESAPR